MNLRSFVHATGTEHTTPRRETPLSISGDEVLFQATYERHTPSS